MAGEDDLVSKVTVTGTEESAAKLNTYADQGAAAFDKLDKAAKKSAADIKAAGKDIEGAAGDAARGVNALGSVNTSGLLRVAPDLKQVEAGAKALVTSVRAGIPAIASFVARLTAAGGAAAAAGVGLLKLAANVAKGGKEQETQTDKVTQAQIASNNASAAAQVNAINLESSQRKLFQQLQSGQITYQDYNKALQNLNAEYKEQQRVAAQTEAVQKSLEEENKRLAKQAADTKAFQAQVDMFGGPLLSSLTALGNAASQVFNEFKQLFGPAISAGVDLITKTLNANGGAISKFFSEASTKIANFISQNGPAIQQALETIGAGIKLVFDGLINALPGLLKFFNESLVPAFKAFGAVLDTIAAAVNKVFGTQFTAGAIVILVIIGQMTGAFVALINVVRIAAAVFAIILGLPFGPVILLAVAAISALLFIFPQLRQVALDVLNSIIQTFQSMAAGATAAVQRVISAWNSVISFFQGLFAAIGALFTGGWAAITAGTQAAVDFVINTWSAIVGFFKGIIDQVVGFFSNLGQQIIDAFTNAFNTVKQAFTDLWNAAKARLQPILDLLRAIAALAATVSGGGEGEAVRAAGGGHIHGKGTSTSDSIPAWLSDGEFVIKAKSVAKYGAGLLHAINSGRFRMPKFNTGGLVSSMISPGPRLAYADGGEVSSPQNLRPLALTLFGETFDGLLAPEDVGTRLTKFAVSRQNKSAGRKPAWLGRGKS